MKRFKILIFGGRIYTMSPTNPICDAMIINGKEIEWLGSVSELSAVPADSYQIIDLGGRIVLPGFIDSHTHLVYWALAQTKIDLDGAASYQEVLTRIRKHIRRTPKGKSGWITGNGWRIEQWRQPCLPHKSDLDKLAPDRPVFLYSKDEHAAWVNSKLLQKAGIDRGTPDPSGGKIERNEAGEPTGILYDEAAWQVFRQKPRENRYDVRKALKHGITRMLALGCVGTSNFDQLDNYAFLADLDGAGKLPIKIVQYLPARFLPEAVKLKLRSGFGSEFLKIGGIKIFADGALGSRTALMLKPYAGGKKNCGLEVTPIPELKSLIKTSSNAALACAIHAIGDRANRNVLDAIEGFRRNISKRYRHRIEHCQIVSPRDLQRFKRQNVIASMQPAHATADIELMKRYLGKRRKDSYRFRKYFELGVTVAFGSDAPIEPPNPLGGIHAAAVGKRPGERACFNSRELITVYEAVRGFTIGGAEAVGEANKRGNLMADKRADFIVLDRDIFRLKTDQLLQTQVDATFINGKLEFSRNGFAVDLKG